MATPTKTEKKVPALSINYCDSQETLDSLVSNNMVNEDELYFFPDPIPSAANNVALLGADGRILDSTKQLTAFGIGADPVGTGLYSSFVDIPENADLNDYTACGYYACDLTTTAKTIANVPYQDAFSLIVYNALGNTSDAGAISGKTWRYRLQRFITLQGAEWVRAINTNGSGEVNIGGWHTVAWTTDTVAAANAVVDYNKSSKQIKIGWNGDSLTTSNLKYLAGYNSDGNIKDVSTTAALNLLGIESGTWTPVVAGASSYSTQVGQYLKIGKMVVLSFQVYGTFSGSTTSRIAITGVPYSPALNGHSSGGGHLSGYTAANNIIFTGWQISSNGNIYAVGQEHTTSGTNKWGSTAIYQKASGDFSAAGTLMFQTS